MSCEDDRLYCLCSSWTCDYTVTVANLTNIHSVEVHQAPRASNGDLVYYLYGPNDNPRPAVRAVGPPIHLLLMFANYFPLSAYSLETQQ